MGTKVTKGELINIQNTSDYFNDVSQGVYDGEYIVNKFGRNGAIGTSLAPVSIGGNYRTPTTAQALEFVSTSANDTAAGSGARSIFIQGLDSNFDLISETIATNGLTPVALVNSYTRVFRFFVATSGTYASQTASSHAGNLILQASGAGDEWARIDLVATVFGVGQSQIGCYTVPRGYTACLLSKHITVETNKPASLYFFKRDQINVASAPFGPMRLFEENDGIQAPFSVNGKAPIQTFDEMTDIGFMSIVGAGTASVSVDFQLHLKPKT